MAITNGGTIFASTGYTTSSVTNRFFITRDIDPGEIILLFNGAKINGATFSTASDSKGSTTGWSGISIGAATSAATVAIRYKQVTEKMYTAYPGTHSNISGTTVTTSGLDPSEWIGAQITVLTGTGSGATGVITANTATSITVSSWTGGTPSGAGTYKLTDSVTYTLSKTGYGTIFSAVTLKGAQLGTNVQTTNIQENGTTTYQGLGTEDLQRVQIPAAGSSTRTCVATIMLPWDWAFTPSVSDNDATSNYSVLLEADITNVGNLVSVWNTNPTDSAHRAGIGHLDMEYVGVGVCIPEFSNPAFEFSPMIF